MTELTAQRILQDWATSRGFSTTLTVDSGKRLYFHFDKFNGFAIINFEKSPTINLVTSTRAGVSAPYAWWNGWGVLAKTPQERLYNEYELSLADEKVFTKIERILERTIDSYGS